MLAIDPSKIALLALTTALFSDLPCSHRLMPIAGLKSSLSPFLLYFPWRSAHLPKRLPLKTVDLLKPPQLPGGTAITGTSICRVDHSDSSVRFFQK
jgi:hypothetical protein